MNQYRGSKRCLHRGDGGGGARSGRESWEGGRSTGSLDICTSLAGREHRNIDLGTRGNRDNFRAVDEFVRVVADNGKLGHDSLELANHEFLVGWEELAR